MTAGALLREAREKRGLTLGQVASATRVREPYLEALEADALHRLPAAAYARGYLRSYAAYLDLDSDALVASLPTGLREPDRVFPARRGWTPAWAPALTPGLLLAGGVAAAVAMLAVYAQHELGLDAATARRPAAIVIASPPATRATPTPPASGRPARPEAAALPGARPAQKVTVSLRFTDQVWVYVLVDGRPVYGTAGRFFGSGDEVSFTGRSVSVTSGKGAATLVSVDGEAVGALPDGVTTRDYTPQT